jgi:hypothetical protein
VHLAGATEITVDMTDTTYSKANGEVSFSLRAFVELFHL